MAPASPTSLRRFVPLGVIAALSFCAPTVALHFWSAPDLWKAHAFLRVLEFVLVLCAVPFALGLLPELERRHPKHALSLKIAVIASAALSFLAIEPLIADYGSGERFTRLSDPSALLVFLRAVNEVGSLIGVVTLVRVATTRAFPLTSRPLLVQSLIVTLSVEVLCGLRGVSFALVLLPLMSGMVLVLEALIALEDRFTRLWPRVAIRSGAALVAAVLLWALLLTLEGLPAGAPFLLVSVSRFLVAGINLFPEWLELTPLLFAGSFGLMSATVSLVLSDLLVLATSRAQSIQTRLLVMSLLAAGVGAWLSSQEFFFKLAGWPPELQAAMNTLASLVVSSMLVWMFATASARRLSQSLQDSAQALASIRGGNLEVRLEAVGRDEVAQVAQAFNGMVAQLREAEFLEQINAGLHGRSTQLQKSLEALRLAQAELVRAERMASVGTLVKGIAHELNNPIGFIAGNMAPLKRYSDFLVHVASELADGKPRTAEELAALTHLTPHKDLAFVAEDLSRMTADVSEGARRARLIIDNLQGLTQASQRGLESVDLLAVARQAVTRFEAGVPREVRIITELLPVPSLIARAGQLEQVLVNLLDNALHAVGPRGTIEVKVAAVGEAVQLTVADDGSGMTDEVQRQALEPFFSTRAAGEGSGLGLAVVASIVRGHQGKLCIDSAPGQGTKVVVELPAQPDPLRVAEVKGAVVASL